MSQPTANYLDGYPIPDRETTTWPVMDFPFENNPIPDVYARTLERHYDVNPQGYVPKNATVASYTNLLTYSNDYSNAAWNKTHATGVANVVANPWDGSITCGTLSEDSTTNLHKISRSPAGLSAAPYVFWVIAAQNTRSVIQIEADDSAAGFSTARFDLSTGTVVATSGDIYTGSSITPLGNGFYLCALMFTASASGTGAVFVSLLSGNLLNYLGSGKGIYLAQAQLQLGGIPGPLILTTSVARTVSVPYVDGIRNSTRPGADIFAFLAKETPPKNITNATAQLERAYARIPAPQVMPDSKPITRPVMDNIFSGSTYAVTFDEGKTSHLFTSRKPITSIGGLILGTIAVPQTFGGLPGDTVTFTDSAGTAVGFAMNATASSVATILNGAYAATVNKFTAASIGGALVISWTNGTGYIKTIETAATLATMSGGPPGTSVTFTATQANNMAPNQNPSVRLINCPGHGASAAGTRAAFWNGNALVARSIVMSVPTVDSFTVRAADVDGKDLVLTHCAFTEDASVRYSNLPTVTCTVRRTQTFYLPGYSMLVNGATMVTFADIPLQAPILDAQSWLDAIVFGSAWGLIDAGSLQPWMGPIFSQEISEVQMADALDSVSVLP